LANAVFTHDLEALVRVAGLTEDLDKDRKSNPSLESNWTMVKDWKETSRYELGITEVRERGLFLACTERRNGILAWIRRRW